MKITKIFTLPDLIYHDNKKDIKKLRDEYGLKWKGIYPDVFRWSDGVNMLRAEYDKDFHYDDYNREMVIGATKEARLIFEGEPDSQFLTKLEELMAKLGIFGMDDSHLTEPVQETISNSKEKEEYLQSVEHQLDCMRRDGAPQGFIDKKRVELMKGCPE